MFSALSGAVINVILNFILIPNLFSIGAAIASVFAEFTILVLFSYFSRDYLFFSKFCKELFKYLFASLCMYFVINLIKFEVSWKLIIFQITCGIVIYITILLLLQDSLLKDGFTKIRNRALRK